MKFRKLNNLGSAHIIVPLLVIVGAGIIGSFFLIQSHAQTPPAGGSGKSLRYQYSGGTLKYQDTKHVTAARHFGANFDMYMNVTCMPSTHPTRNVGFAFDFDSGSFKNFGVTSYGTENKTWYRSYHLHSAKAQTIQMEDYATACEYTVQVYQ